MRFDKFTSRLQTALSEAQSLALGKDHNFIEPAHLMHVLLEQSGGAISTLLAQAGVDLNSFRQQLATQIDRIPQVQGADADVHLSNELGRLLNMADKLAQKRQDQYISSELIHTGSYPRSWGAR